MKILWSMGTYYCASDQRNYNNKKAHNYAHLANVAVEHGLEGAQVLRRHQPPRAPAVQAAQERKQEESRSRNISGDVNGTTFQFPAHSCAQI